MKQMLCHLPCSTRCLCLLCLNKAEARGCDYVVLWLDCDKEGENICFEVIQTLHVIFSASHINQAFIRDGFLEQEMDIM